MTVPGTHSPREADPIVDDHGVVIVPEDLGGSRARRVLARIVIGLFLAVIVATPLVDTFWPYLGRIPVGLEKEREDAVRARTRVLDGSWAKQVERDLERTSRIRNSITSPYTLALFLAFREMGRTVIVGRERWMFLLDRAVPPPVPDADLAGRAASTLHAMQRRLADAGIRLVVLPIPRKEVVCAEHLPPGFDARPEVDRAIEAELSRRGVEHVDLLAAFEGEDMPLYHPYGSHWTEHAQLVAAKKVARAIGLLKPPKKRWGRLLQHVGTRDDGDILLITIGVDPEPAIEFGKKGIELEILRLIARKGGTAPGSPATMQRIALTGTSFSEHLMFCRLIEHFTAEPVYNAAKSAQDPSWTLRQILTKVPANERPELIVMEVPIHFLFDTPLLPDINAIYAHVAPAATAVVLEEARVRNPGAPRNERVQLGVWRAATFPPGLLAHDGSAALRLRGAVDADAQVELWCEGVKTSFLWPRGSTELVVPLVVARANSLGAYVDVRARPGAVLLEEIAVVATGDEAQAQEFEVAPPERSGGAWHQELRPRTDAPLAPRSTFVARLQAKAPLAEPVTLELLAEDGRREVWTFGALAPEAAIVLDLSAWAGATLRSARLNAAAGPDSAVATARVLPPGPPRRE